jgi:hypothetical protein
MRREKSRHLSVACAASDNTRLPWGNFVRSQLRYFLFLAFLLIECSLEHSVKYDCKKNQADCQQNQLRKREDSRCRPVDIEGAAVYLANKS